VRPGSPLSPLLFNEALLRASRPGRDTKDLPVGKEEERSPLADDTILSTENFRNPLKKICVVQK
jgi:hypothetical protein